mmetsp:Transcript_132663/g.412519  ORF Transcript_132663/g.412519 Transcript_132663/m.412519 type:complete len:590 (-) Transcript_132663:78-1847(-)
MAKPEFSYLATSASGDDCEGVGQDDSGRPPLTWHRRRWAVGLCLFGGALGLAASAVAVSRGRARRTRWTEGSEELVIDEALQYDYQEGKEIPTSRSWWSCSHQYMNKCGKGCCCDTDFVYTLLEGGRCLHVGQVPGSKDWLKCSKNMFTCGHHCCCRAGYEFNPEDSGCHHPVNEYNKKLDSGLFDAQRGLYYAFKTAEGDTVLDGQVQSTLGGWEDSDDSFPLASASKLFTAFAAMRTMQLKPRDFYPKKYVHQFKGWESFRQFRVHGSSRKADLTIHNLLTHTSGLPFAMRDSKEDIQKLTLFYWPGTKFGYTLGHRVIGWLLRDFWMSTPEGRRAGLRTVQDTYKWLIFDKLGLSSKTKFDNSFELEFGTSGEAGDAALASTGEDMAKLAVVALRKGKLPSGEQLISEANWNAWAVKNLLPGGKLSKQLVDWQVKASSWADWNIAGLKGSIMKQSGDYGWNYFGATYDGSREIGWCGFFSSCLRVSYPRRLAFVMMQRDVVDLKKSKPYVVQHFDSMARSLQCTVKTCRSKGSPVFCQKCTKFNECKNQPMSSTCPVSIKRRSSLIVTDRTFDPGNHACYIPSCTG